MKKDESVNNDVKSFIEDCKANLLKEGEVLFSTNGGTMRRLYDDDGVNNCKKGNCVAGCGSKDSTMALGGVKLRPLTLKMR